MKRQSVRDLLWKHEYRDVYVVGSGTSLADFDFRKLDGRVTIALNGAMLAPRFVPTYHLFADEWQAEKCEHAWTAVTTVVVPQSSAHLVGGKAGAVATWTPVSREIEQVGDQWVWPSVAVDVDSDELYCHFTISIAGIELAYKLGAHRVFLLGLDGYTTPSAAYFDGTKDRFPVDFKGAHDVGDGRIVAQKHMTWLYEHGKLREWFAELGYVGPNQTCGVWNCSERSTLTAWPKISVESITTGGQNGNSCNAYAQCRV